MTNKELAFNIISAWIFSLKVVNDFPKVVHWNTEVLPILRAAEKEYSEDIDGEFIESQDRLEELFEKKTAVREDFLSIIKN